ncbi:SusC/RagA family TonB-linked outer membrane protein [Chitinophaga sp.]|uniref:SusC/RagA family TonB-linked outer membrane protein n=1 Tax=Chitinophaga sp. TaxID=1869181 RepID=UPI0026121303|nr:SusC/RagA family TonB-linked outer membrane protein [uncultured Chitinophaga sp.]
MKENFKLRFLALLLAFTAVSTTVLGQELTVTGTVTSEKNGEPLPGVSVTLLNSTKSAITDEKGFYRIALPSLSGTLVFSYIGMEKKAEPIGNRTQVNIQLAESNSALQEVVVTAIGIERKRAALGYSAQVVNGSELTEAREVNVANSLKGKVAGVFVSASATGPGGSSYVNIRGASSFQGNNQPLYVVDGVPIDNQTIGAPDLGNARGTSRDYGDGIGNISPDDIETITVLKGPNGASLYGARGANGVILITTKKGKAGKRAKIDFNSNATWEKPLVTPQRQNSYGPGYNESIESWDLVTIDGREVRQLPAGIPDMWGAKFDGQPIALELWPSLGVFSYSGKGSGESRKFYATGSTYTNSLAVSGGSEKINYRVSFSDLRNKGIYPTSTLDRQTINTTLGFQATDKLYIETRVNYIRQAGKNRPGFGTDINTIGMSLNRFPAFLSMDMMKDYKTFDGQANNWTDGRPFNPYWVLNEFLSNDSRDRVNGYLLARYKLTPWLMLQARGGTDFYFDVRDSRIGVNTPTGSGNLRRGQVNNDRIRMREDNFDVLLTANGALSDKFTGTFSVGANRLDRKQQEMSLQGNNLNIDHLYNIINAGLVVPTDRLNRRRMNSGYFTGQIGYNNFLFLDISGRNDWSSTLGANNYSFFYPAASASFVFSDAFQIKSDKWLSFGKVRLSYAQAGKDASAYQTQIGYNLSTLSYNGQRMATTPGTIPLVDLKNELTTSFETGTELKFFRNRLGIDFTYYHARAKNQILGVDIPAPTGFSRKLINAGEIRNRGLELMVTGTPVSSRGFTWNISVNASRNRSEVVSLAPGINSLNLYSTGEMSIEARPGLPYGNIVGYKFKRTATGEKWLNSAGAYQRDATTSVLGNVQPDYLAGITNNLSYKGLSLSFLIDVRQGGKIFSYSKQQQWSVGTGKGTENGDNLIADGVIEGADGKFTRSNIVLGRAAYYTSMSYGNISEEFVLDASYIALRELTLGYNVGKHFRQGFFLKSAKLTAVCRNVLYLKQNAQIKEMGANPEGGFGPFTVAQGFESTGVPITRNFGLNLSVSL